MPLLKVNNLSTDIRLTDRTINAVKDVSFEVNHEIDWRWVKGHSGHKENELVDQLANEAIDELSVG